LSGVDFGRVKTIVERPLPFVWKPE